MEKGGGGKGQKENKNYESQIVVIRNLTLCK